MGDHSGFKHSIKVNTQYKKVARALKIAIENKQSLKTLIYEEQHARKRSMQAVLNHYINNQRAIDYAIEKCEILTENPRMCPYLCKILVTELLFGRKQLNGESRPVVTVYNYQSMLTKAVSEMEEKHGVVSKTQTVTKLRYVRVNTNTYSLNEAIDMLASEKWRKKELTSLNPSYEELLKAAAELEEDEYLIDIHVSGLFIFHAKTRHYWPTDPFVMEKKLILQDKGTCLVAEMLDPPPGAVLLDLCAAPGMKTIHACNLMQNKGRIFAVERDLPRFRLMTKMVSSAGCDIVVPIQDDALLIGNDQCPGVEYILVDPTCSGSGMQNRMALEHNEEKDVKRLKKLAGLQIKILSHAMTNFPMVKRIVYCTCSVHEEENEQVVQRCLQLHPEFKLLSGRKTLRNKWPHGGNSAYANIGKHCICTKPDIDLADGIFIALIEKQKNI